MKEPRMNRSTSRQSIIEFLMRPVVVLMESRVKAILNSAVDAFPDECPHCGKPIDLLSREHILAKQVSRNEPDKTAIIRSKL